MNVDVFAHRLIFTDFLENFSSLRFVLMRLWFLRSKNVFFRPFFSFTATFLPDSVESETGNLLLAVASRHKLQDVFSTGRLMKS